MSWAGKKIKKMERKLRDRLCTSKEKSSWLKHLEFIIPDICALAISFVAACVLKFDNMGILHSASWRSIAAIAG